MRIGPRLSRTSLRFRSSVPKRRALIDPTFENGATTHTNPYNLEIEDTSGR